MATPIGNIGDITLRAIDILAGADLIVCEDTRVTGKLLKAFDIQPARLLSYNDHNAAARIPAVISALEEKKVVALVSDAGMPLISDPGYKLVRKCNESGINITTAPGANAPLAALQLSGLPCDKFSFLGFLPSKKNARREMISRWSSVQGSLIMFESASRIAGALADLADILGEREAAVTRELTKMYEEVRRGVLGELASFYRKEGGIRGEIVIVVGPAEKESPDMNFDEHILSSLETMSLRDAVSFVAEVTGAPKKKVYQRALELKGDETDAGL